MTTTSHSARPTYEQLLELEKAWLSRRDTGGKTQVARERWGLGITRYYQLLNAALDDVAFMQLDPVTVRILRERRTRGRRSRSARAS